MTNLQNYLFRVYNKFHIVSLDNHPNLKEGIQFLNNYKLNDLVRLLLFGHIDNNGYYNRNNDAESALLSLLSSQDDGSISPLAVDLIRNMPNSSVFRVDLGYLLLGGRDKPEYKVSLDTFMWILIFYTSKHYRNITQNLIRAIQVLTAYCETGDGSIILERFPKLRDDIDILKGIIAEAKSENHITNPSIFTDVIKSINTELLNYIETHKKEILKNNKIKASSGVGGSGPMRNDLVAILEAMFDIFKAGYYPASIASILPDTIFATMKVGGAGNISGLADYLLSLSGREYFDNNANIDEVEEVGLVRVVLRGTYATTCILNQNYERWSHIEKRLPGAWKLFKIIYNRLRNGEYDTDKYKFSAYRLPPLINASNEDLEEAAKVTWFTLFSSFIMGHILNLIGRRDAKHLYKVAAPVVRLSQENSYLVPDKPYNLKDVVVRYDLEGQIELRPTFLGKWLKYVADDYYTATSNNPAGGVGYNSRYSIVITQQDDKIPKEITIQASDSNHKEWQEVVEGKPVLSGGDLKSLDLFFYDDAGNPIDIANVTANVGATNSGEEDFIEPKELSVRKIAKDSSENE